MANDSRLRNLTTKDDVPLSEIMMDGLAIFDEFTKADRPFRQLLTQNVSDNVFRTVADGDMTWSELAEGEHARTGDIQSTEVAMNVSKFGRSLGFTPEFIEDNPADEVTKRFLVLVEGALKREHKVVFDTLKTGVSDGTEIWYGSTEHGAYSFTETHNHTFDGTDPQAGANANPLFDSDGAQTPTAHIRAANAQLRHHGKRPTLALCSSEFAAKFVDELAYDAAYHIPDATSLRSEALPETTIGIDGVRLLQTPWINGEGTSEHTFYVMDDSKPIYFHEKRPVQLTAGESGGPIGDPASLVGAWGSARYGTFMADPLAAVKVTADNLA